MKVEDSGVGWRGGVCPWGVPFSSVLGPVEGNRLDEPKVGDVWGTRAVLEVSGSVVGVSVGTTGPVQRSLWSFFPPLRLSNRTTIRSSGTVVTEMSDGAHLSNLVY